jgi:hypothetical protein
VVHYGQPPRRSGRHGDGPSVGAVTTAEGIFIWKGAIQSIPQKGRFVKCGRMLFRAYQCSNKCPARPGLGLGVRRLPCVHQEHNGSLADG